MTDALWNGIIGAGGAAICCAVYFTYKGVKNLLKNYRAKSPKMDNNIDTEVEKMPQDDIDKGKTITFTLPRKNQIFTKQNFRALMYLVIAGYSIGWAIDLQYDYSTPAFDWITFNGEYESYVVELQRSNIVAIGGLGNFLGRAFFYLFWLIGLIFFTLGITGFSFKKRSN